MFIKSLTQKQQLYPYEWIAIVLLIAVLGMLTMINLIREETFSRTQIEVSEGIADSFLQVHVSGAVENAGSFQLPTGSKMKDLLLLAKPKADADLRRIKGDSKLKQGQVIKILSRDMLTIHLEGEIKNPGTIQIPKGTRLSDLPTLIHLNPNADLKIFQRKRKIREDEVIHIPALRK